MREFIVPVEFNGYKWESRVYDANEADAEIAKYKLGFERYEKVRRLNARQFAELFSQNLHGKGDFDYLVDLLPSL